MKTLGWMLLAMGVCSCASVAPGPELSRADRDNAAELVVEQATVWGLIGGTTASPFVYAVNGQRHRITNPRLKPDDSFYLLAGDHVIGLGVMGSPKGYGLSTTESYGCLRVTAQPRAHYVLRGYVEGEGFRVDLLQRDGGADQVVSTVSFPAGARIDREPCETLLQRS